MTSAELKHQTKLREWIPRVQKCRSSGMTVQSWCKMQGYTLSTYYRREHELLAKSNFPSTAQEENITFAELPVPKHSYFNGSECSATSQDTRFGTGSSANVTAVTLERGIAPVSANNSHSQR